MNKVNLMIANVNENINIWISQINNDYKSAISVDCVIFGYDDNTLKILTSKCDMPPFEDERSLIGDIVKPQETTDDAALRVLKSKTGFDDVFMDQVKVFSAIDRHPLARVITVAYYSLILIDDGHLAHLDKSSHLAWVNVDDISSLAFDHFEIMHTSLNMLRKRLREGPIGFNLLPEKFTLLQIQNLYEAILGLKLDKRNFRRKLTALEILSDRGIMEAILSHRPARQYSFNIEKYQEKKKTGFVFDL